MSKCSLFLRDREDASGQKAIGIQVSHNGKSFKIATSQKVTADQWQSQSCRQITLAKAFLAKVQMVIDNLSLEGKLADTSVEDLKTMCSDALGLKSSPRKRLLMRDLINGFVEKKVARRTKELYLSTLTKLRQYTDIGTLSILDINRTWLEDFDLWMIHDGLATNTRAIHMRNLRAIFNEAIKNEIIVHYPFRSFQIKREETRHRVLTIEQLRALRDAVIDDPVKQMYRDLFMLDFYLLGINSVDLFNATHEQIVNGRLEYRRRKTGKLLSIKIEPEAAEILEKYKGEKLLLSPLEKYGNLHDFNRRWCEGLATIGTGSRRGKKGTSAPLLPPGVTPYWCRHTFASICFNECGLSKDTVSLCLGHSFGVLTTDIYIAYNNKIIDEANRKVIDSLG